MNQDADMLIFLLALKHGETSFAAGLAQIPPFLRTSDLTRTRSPSAMAAATISPTCSVHATVSQLLRAMTTQPDFASLL